MRGIGGRRRESCAVRCRYIVGQRSAEAAAERDGQTPAGIECVDELRDVRAGLPQQSRGNGMRSMREDRGRERRISGLSGPATPDDEARPVGCSRSSEQFLRKSIGRDAAVQRLLSMGDRAQAERIYGKMLENDPNSTDALRGLAAMAVQTGNFEAALQPIPGVAPGVIRGSDIERWDGRDLRQLSGTYGDYLLSKVSKVFPDLGRQHLA